jgi:hypothetical protein
MAFGVIEDYNLFNPMHYKTSQRNTLLDKSVQPIWQFDGGVLQDSFGKVSPRTHWLTCLKG